MILIGGIITDINYLNFDNFWRKVFNLGAGEVNRISGYETLEAYGISCHTCYRQAAFAERHRLGSFC